MTYRKSAAEYAADFLMHKTGKSNMENRQTRKSRHNRLNRKNRQTRKSIQNREGAGVAQMSQIL